MHQRGLPGILLLSVVASSYAQDTTFERLPPEEKLFAFPPFSIKRTYYVTHDKGNRLQVDVGDFIILASRRDGHTLYDRIGFFINSHEELEPCHQRS